MVKRYAVLLLASMLSAVATAAGTGQHGVTLRLGANIGFSFATGFAIGEGAEVGWSMLRGTSARWDFQMGAAFQHYALRRTLVRSPFHADSRAVLGVVGLAVDLKGRRWMGERGKRWFMVVGAQVIAQAWGYVAVAQRNPKQRFWVSYPPAWRREQYGSDPAFRDAIYPVVPALAVGVGYRFAACPLEVSADFVQEGVMRLFPHLYDPPFSHLFSSSYGGVSVSWWF